MKNEDGWLTFIGGRKFLIAIIAFIMFFWAFMAGKLSADQWTQFTTWVLGLYLGANVVKAATEK